MHSFYIIKPSKLPHVVESYGFSKFPLREFCYAKTIFNTYNIFLQTETAYPGFVFTTNTGALDNRNIINQCVTLESSILNFPLSFVFNKKNTFACFARSSGVCAYKRKVDKKTKLTVLELPSTQTILLAASTFCTYAAVQNLFLNKRVGGSWGNTYSYKKHIVVRGVAKNPVDHPNGGRTKAKQPELSPWGWIAKKNK